MYNKLWGKMPPRTRERDIHHWVERFRPLIDELMNESDDKVHHFNYVIDVWDWNNITLYDNGVTFASCNLELIETPGDLIAWISDAISTRYFDYFDPEEIEEAAEKLKSNRNGEKL